MIYLFYLVFVISLSYYICIHESFTITKIFKRTVPSTNQKRTLIIVSDSKGKYLKRCVQNIVPEKNTVFEFKGGRTTKQAEDYICSNIDYYIHRYGSILLVLWTGTCDLTKKVQSKQFNGKIIVDLSDTSVEEIVIQYQRFFSLCQSRGDLLKSLLLECPYYSITIWNSFQGHPDSSVYDHSNKVLHEKITELNDKIKCLNSEQGIISPRFSTDMIKCRKLKKSLTPLKQYHTACYLTAYIQELHCLGTGSDGL